MNKDLEQIVNVVAEQTELRPVQILGKRRFQEVTDARWMVVYLLREKGYYPSQIAAWMSMTPRNVNLILSSMHDRLKYEKHLRSNLESARNNLF